MVAGGASRCDPGIRGMREEAEYQVFRGWNASRGLWRPLPLREGPGPLEGRNAPTSAPPACPAAELELTGGCRGAVWSQPGRGWVCRLVLAFRSETGWGGGGVGRAFLSKILGQSSLFFCNLFPRVNSAPPLFGKFSHTPSPSYRSYSPCK